MDKYHVIKRETDRSEEVNQSGELGAEGGCHHLIFISIKLKLIEVNHLSTIIIPLAPPPPPPPHICTFIMRSEIRQRISTGRGRSIESDE